MGADTIAGAEAGSGSLTSTVELIVASPNAPRLGGLDDAMARLDALMAKIKLVNGMSIGGMPASTSIKSVMAADMASINSLAKNSFSNWISSGAKIGFADATAQAKKFSKDWSGNVQAKIPGMDSYGNLVKRLTTYTGEGAAQTATGRTLTYQNKDAGKSLSVSQTPDGGKWGNNIYKVGDNPGQALAAEVKEWENLNKSVNKYITDSTKGREKARTDDLKQEQKGIKSGEKLWTQDIANREAAIKASKEKQFSLMEAPSAAEKKVLATRTRQEVIGNNLDSAAATKQRDEAYKAVRDWRRNQAREQTRSGTISTPGSSPSGDRGMVSNRDMLSNLTHVTTWAASIAVLYGALNIAKFSMVSLINTGLQVARLKQVFTGPVEQIDALRNSVLGLAANYGRTSDESMAAAVSWSRMGLKFASVNEAVRVSLMAANVAEMTAAEATNHLQALMQTYGLRVSELAGVLGGLNQISNTYNVTVNDLLTGLSRVSAVAAQAGLPLVELEGLMGATIGKTKQSGANIGNAMKSIITAVGNPAIQSFLKGFGIEVKTGDNGELKDMSEALRELYVRYQEMSKAEQQWLTFRVAGKTQSTRFTAMLDSYVRGQVLAVQAQMNLNSAEAENVLITNTLKSSLQGLVTEWERFVSIQGNASAKFGGIEVGPMNALTEITRSFRGVLSLMNTGAGSAVTTGFMAMFTVMSAKLAITAITMKSAAGATGLMANTLRHLAAAWAMLGGAMTGAVSKFATTPHAVPLVGGIAGGTGRAGDWLINAGDYNRMGYKKGAQSAWSPGQKGGGKYYYDAYSGGGNIVKGEVQAENKRAATQMVSGMGLIPLKVFGTSADEATSKTGKLTSALGGAKTAFGGLIKSAAVAMVGLYEFALPILAIYGAIKIFNFAMESWGYTVNKSTDSMAKLTEASEKAMKASEGYARIATLIDTLQQRRKSASPDQWKQMAKDVAPLGINLNATPEDLEKQKTKAILLSYESRGRAIEMNKRKLEEANKELEKDNLSKTARAKAMENQEEAQAALTKSLTEQIEAQQELLDMDVKRLGILAAQAAQIKLIGDIYSALPSIGKADKLGLDASSKMARASSQQRFLDQVDKEEARGFKTKDEEVKRNAEIQKEIDAKQQSLAKVQGKRDTASKFFPGVSIPADEWIFSPDIAARKKEIDALKAKQRTIPQNQTLSVTERAKIKKEIDDLVSGAQGDLANIPTAMVEDQVSMAKNYAGMEANRNTYGANKTEELLRRRKYLDESAGKQADIAVKSPEGLQQRNAAVIAMQNLLDSQKVMMSLKEREVELDKEANQLIVQKNMEFKKSIMMAGPADLLRKMTAFKAANRPGGLGMGEWFAMSPEMRGDVGMANGRYSSEGRENAYERGQLKASRFGNQSLESMQKMEAKYQQLVASIGAGFKLPAFDAMGSSALTTATSIKDLGGAAEQAANALFMLKEEIQAFKFGNQTPAGNTAPGQPPLAQASARNTNMVMGPPSPYVGDITR